MVEDLKEKVMSPEKEKPRYVFVAEDDLEARNRICESLRKFGLTPYWPSSDLIQSVAVMIFMKFDEMTGAILDGNLHAGDKRGYHGKLMFDLLRELYPEIPVIIHSRGYRNYGDHLYVSKEQTQNGKEIGEIAYDYFVLRKGYQAKLDYLDYNDVITF